MICQNRSRCLVTLLALFVLLLSLLLAACDTGSSHPNQVIFWSADTAPVDVKAFNQIVKAFNQANPNLYVTYVVVPSQAPSDLTALMTSVRGGTGPDVYELDRFVVNQYAAIGLLQDLQPFIDKDQRDLEKQYLPFAWRETLFQGHPYALPLDTDARALFYSKDLLQQAGIDLSVLDPSKGPILLDQLKTIAMKLNETDTHGRYTRVGFLPFNGQAFHTTWGIDFGAKFYDPRTCQITPTEPAMVRAFRMMYDWANDMDVQRVQTYMATYSPAYAPPSQNPFFTGHLAMTIDGDWLLSNIEEYVPKLNYGITYLPVVSGHTPFTWSGGFSAVIPKGAGNPPGAYRFMRFLTGPQGQRIYTKVTARMPTWATLLKDNSLFSGNHKFFKAMLSSAQSRVPLPVGAQLSDELDTAQQKIVLNAATPEQALQEVYHRVQPQLQQYCPLKQ